MDGVGSERRLSLFALYERRGRDVLVLVVPLVVLLESAEVAVEPVSAEVAHRALFASVHVVYLRVQLVS